MQIPKDVFKEMWKTTKLLFGFLILILSPLLVIGFLSSITDGNPAKNPGRLLAIAVLFGGGGWALFKKVKSRKKEGVIYLREKNNIDNKG